MILAHSITKYQKYFEHAILFEFGGKSFEVLIVDSNDETYVSEAFLLEKGQQPIEIEIPKFFGGFATDIYKMLYDRVHEPIEDSSNDVEYDT